MLLGTGVYRLNEVARYTGLPTSTVRSWFKMRSDKAGHGPIFRADHAPRNGLYTVSFLNLIDTYVVRFFREEGVTPTAIRAAYHILQQRLGVQHPFAHASLCTDGRRIIEKSSDEIGGQEFTDVVTRQRFFSYIRDGLKHIDYEPKTHLASRWHIAAGVVIDPAIRFGQPVIEGTGVTTLVLKQQFDGNCGNAALVADLFAITKQDVMNAVTFEAHLEERRQAA